MDLLLFFKSLADDTRLRSLLLIADQGELCVCELTVALAESQPKISRHLAQLRANSLLTDRRQGQWVYYQLNPNLPAWAREILTTMQQANSGAIESELDRLAAMGEDRPARQGSCC